MFKFIISAAFASVLFLNSVSVKKGLTANTPTENFKTYCSSCHGQLVEVFVDRVWSHGRTKSNLIASITSGYTSAGMPAYRDSLSATEISDLADLFLEDLKGVDQYNFPSKQSSNVFSSDGMSFRLDTVAAGMSSPWGMAFLPDGDMLVNDKVGDMYRIGKSRQKTKVTGTPSVIFLPNHGQGGLLDLALHPNFANNQLIYFSYLSPDTDLTNGNELWGSIKVMRAKLEGNMLTNQQVIFDSQPHGRLYDNFGSRIVFDDAGYLYVTVGDFGTLNSVPQDVGYDWGKIHRLNDDGTIPTDNPFVKSGSSKSSIYSVGHRNPQGMIVHPLTREIWVQEHGPRGGDELNILKKGANYGWPVITYGINYDYKPISKLTAKAGMEQPLTYWTTCIAPSGMTYVTSSKYPAWNGNLLMGSLRFQYLNRMEMNGTQVVKQEFLMKNIGRVRDVRQGPDGYLYVSVESPGYIYRLLPCNSCIPIQVEIIKR